NGDISSWDVSNVTNMGSMFSSASSFNGDVSSWDVSNVTNMSRMFSGAEAFNGEVSRWDVSNVTNMSRMFSGAEAFNGEVSRWDVSSVTDMLGMFSSVSSFNQDLSSWDVSGVTNMSFMFRNATSFNQPLNNWDVSSVTNMFRMFHQASTFNQPLNNWDVSSVRDMEEMFHIAEQFNQPLDNWDVSSVTDMEEMFNRAEQFNQPLNTWNIGQVSDMTGMLFGSRLSRSNYDRTLIGWTQQPVQQNVELGAGERTFCAGEEARNVLRREKDWTIKNDEKDCGPTYSALVAFTVPGQTGRTTFNDPGRTARAEVEPGTDLSALAPVLTIPPGATSSPGVRQTVDFTVPVTYTITAPNGTTTQEWTVEVVEETVPPLLITREVDDPGYHMLSAPASGPLFDELLHGFWTQGLTGGDREDGFPILYTWDAENQTWVAMGDLATEPLVPGQGFMFYVYPDDNGPGVPGGTEFPKLLTSERFVEDENVEMNAGDIPAITDLGDGAFFLAGNPYWETIDWNKLEKTGLSESFYVYDPSINGYRVCNSGSILCDVTLAPYQGFFVEGFGGDGSLTFTEEAIVDEEPAEEVLAKTNPKKKDTQLEARMLGLVANTEGRISEAWVSFQDGGKPGRDVYDGLTLASLDTTYLQLFTLTEEHQALTINVLPPEPEKEYRLPLELAGRGFGETAELTFTGLEAFEGWDITLVDIETGQEYDITSGDTLTVHIEPGQVPAKAKGSLGTATPQAVKTSTSRYELVLVSPGYEEGADGPELPTEVALSQNYPNPFNPATIIKYALPGRSDVRLEVYDIVGRKVATLVNGEPQSAGRYEVRFDASTLASGMYLYRLETLSAGGTGGNKILVRKMMLIK
ncbi:MAG: BspA family leucine-rich repeat surface protein, partial [Bacteroidota bacterium]